MQEPTQLPMPMQPASDLISMEPVAPEEVKQETQDHQPMEVDTIAAAATTSSPPAEESAAAEQPKVQENLNKCWHCTKKVGMMKAPCKCSFVFCPKHRHAEAHECTFDYFGEN